MRELDWLVLSSALLFIVCYGVWKGRGSKDARSYYLGNNSMRWYTVALSIMATQASAITFLSTPGQAYVDGMRFVQFYFGLPIAMVILSITAVPLYHKLKVYTAYEYLETKFDGKTRSLAALLFLTQRGLAAGLTIYAPSIILSIILGWDLHLTILVVGLMIIVYTSTGGVRAVGYTQFYQALIIFTGMCTAFIIMLSLLPSDVSFVDALHVAGKLGKLNAIDFKFDLNNRYNVWSGIIGGLFLQLSYFGTDQSQVGRYLSGQTVTQSKLGLLFNGLAKVPMQFSILFLGAMMFVFYQFVAPPIFFNRVETEKISSGVYAEQFHELESRYQNIFKGNETQLRELIASIHSSDRARIETAERSINASKQDLAEIRTATVALMKKNDPAANTNDTNYVFLTFVINFLPVGVVGLVLAAILSAAMSSTAAEINSLGTTIIVDIYKRYVKKDADERHYVRITKFTTAGWGFLIIIFAELANQLGSLVEAVNILGSLFYGTILGIFLSAFYVKFVRGTAVFIAAIIAEFVVLYCYFFTGISFLWYNVIGCVIVMGVGMGIQAITQSKKKEV